MLFSTESFVFSYLQGELTDRERNGIQQTHPLSSKTGKSWVESFYRVYLNSFDSFLYGFLILILCRFIVCV